MEKSNLLRRQLPCTGNKFNVLASRVPHISISCKNGRKNSVQLYDNRLTSMSMMRAKPLANKTDAMSETVPYPPHLTMTRLELI
jgi:hypothetical protein